MAGLSAPQMAWLFFAYLLLIPISTRKFSSQPFTSPSNVCYDGNAVEQSHRDRLMRSTDHSRQSREEGFHGIPTTTCRRSAVDHRRKGGTPSSMEADPRLLRGRTIDIREKPDVSAGPDSQTVSATRYHGAVAPV